MDQFRKVLQPLSTNLYTTTINSLQNSHEDIDIVVQKEYLDKLKSQREKTQKLYGDYVQLLAEKQSLTSQVKNLQKAQDQTKKQLYEKESQIHSLEDQLMNLKQQVSVLQKDRNKSLQQIQIYYKKEMEQLNTYIESLRKSEREKDQRINKLNNITQNKDDQISMLKQKINEMERQFIEFKEQKNKEIDQFKTQIQNSKEVQRKLKKEQQRYALDFGRAKDDLQFKNSQYESIKTLYQNLKETQKTQNKLIAELKQKALQKQLNTDLNVKVKELQQINEKIRSTSKKDTQTLKNIYEQTIQKLKIQLNQEKKKHNDYKMENQKIQAQIKSLLVIIQNLKKQLEQYKPYRTFSQQIKQQNTQLIEFIKKRQILENQRRLIHESEFNQIDKLQNMLKNVK